MAHSDDRVTLRLHRGERGSAPAAPPPPRTGHPGRDELLARTAALCTQALTAARADPAPAAELLWLADQLADTSRLLHRLTEIGNVAAAAYERGHADALAAARPRPA